MKYEVLHKRLMSNEVVALRSDDYPEYIAIPVDGYVVPMPEKGHYSVSVDDFDEAVDLAIMDCEEGGFGLDFILAMIDDDGVLVQPAKLFRSKEYAFGYAEGVGSDIVYDAFADRILFRHNTK